MNKTYLIFKHEFMHLVKRSSWVIMTLFVPVLALLGIGIFTLIAHLAQPAKEEVRSIGYVDEIGIFTDQTPQGYLRLVPYASKEEAYRAMVKKEISDYFIIPSDYKSSGQIQRYTFEKGISTPPFLAGAIKSFITANLLRDKVSPDLIEQIVTPLKIEVTRISATGEINVAKRNVGYLIMSGIFSLLLGLSLMFGATTLVSGLGEEKESRLIEVLFSSVSVRQLLMGKVMAFGTAGLLQILVWLLSIPLILSLASSSFGGSFNNIHVTFDFMILGIIYFILGYLLFAVISIGVGAISSNAREGSQLSLFYTLTSFVPLWFSSLLIAFPNSSIWVVMTLFPVTAPVQTMLRLGISGIPLWQIVLSTVLMVLTIIGGLFLSIKIFRINMLMHGKRTGIGEILRGLKSA